jgi:acetolactate synthase-1/3 small subunit
MVIEITGTTEKIDTFVELMRPYGITEMARSGAVALVRGDQAGIRLADLGLEAEPPGGSRVGAGSAGAGITADTTGDI